MNRKKLAAWAGMIGPIVFILVFTLEGLFRLNYNSFEMYISDLSTGPYGWIQIVNFIILGIACLMFTYGVVDEFHDGKMAKAGFILLAIIGFSLFFSGPFITDPINTPRHLWTLHGTIHQLFGALVFLLSPVSCFVFWRCFRNNLEWKSLQLWTFAAGTIVAITVLFLKIGSIQTSFSTNDLTGWLGLIQRTTLIIYLIWIFTFALRLYRRASKNFRKK